MSGRLRGAPKVAAPRPFPDNVVIVLFVPDPTRVYKLWVRLEADGNSWASDSIWIQFSDSTDGGGKPK